MPRYAARTEVSPEDSRGEIERLVRKYGALGFAYGYEGNKAMLGFKTRSRSIRFIIPMPDEPEDMTVVKERRKYEQEVRRLWRSAVLIIKAKFEAVESGIVTFDQEWLYYIVTDDGSTVGDHIVPQLGKGKPMPLLPDFHSGNLIEAEAKVIHRK